MILAAALLLACAPEPAPAAAVAPKALLIVLDTTRAGFGGAPKPAWWKEGREYTQAYSASNGTAASSVALLTDHLPTSPEERLHPTGGIAPCEIPPNWHPGPMLHERPAGTWFDSILTDQPVIARIYGGGSTERIGKIGSEELVARAIDALDAPLTGRSLVVWARGGHAPLYDVKPGPEARRTLSDIETTKQWRCDALDADHQAGIRLTYRSAEEHALDGLAPLIGAASVAGVTVIVTGDHGESLGELSPTTGRPAWGHTTDLHDPQVHVPLYIRGPGVEPGVDDRPVPATCVSSTARAILDGYLPPSACDLRTGEGLDGVAVEVGMLVNGEWITRHPVAEDQEMPP